MVTICPTITAENTHQYREQIERVVTFAGRIHFDFMDGLFTKSRSIPIEAAWVPEGVVADFHIMYLRPDLFIGEVIRFKPNLIVVHAEAKGDFSKIAELLHSHGIKVGVALLQDTPVSHIVNALSIIDHVLIFSGNLGYFGGKVNFNLLDKVDELKKLKPGLEIGWDGGISDESVLRLAKGGVDVLNVGGFIQRSENPAGAYAKLVEVVGN